MPVSRRCPCCGGYRDQYDACHFHETADEVERLREENAYLRERIADLEFELHHRTTKEATA